MDARKNLTDLLTNPPPPSEDVLEEARAAVARMDARADEVIDVWAERLAADLVAAGEIEIETMKQG